jgi:DNA-binding MarR family transcriptional regulator
MNLDFIRRMIDLAEAYEQSGGDTVQFDDEDFIAWMMTRRQVWKTPAAPGETPNGLIAMYLSFMARYAQFYGRRVFRGSKVYSEDDWGVLVSLYPTGRMTKTEVMRGCIMEKSSGNEVLKRLLKNGLLREFPHPDDGRSKLVELTDAGRAAFESVHQGIDNLSNIVVADLDEEEKQMLLRILVKLNRYHKPVFEAADEQKLEAMLKKAP